MHEAWWLYIVYTISSVIIVMIIDALVAIIIRRMPEKIFTPNKKLFQVKDKEIKFYMFLKVNKWKKYIPELGGFTNFHKNKVEDPFNKEYINRYILEVCYGISIHLYSIPLSFLALLFDYKIYIEGYTNLWLTIILPIVLVNTILNLLPTFILRFNLPRLIRINKNNDDLMKN